MDKCSIEVNSLGCMINLNREQKIAFARIITDLIEADFVVEGDEMIFFEKIISNDCLSISNIMLIEAKKMDFAQALSILKGLDINYRVWIIDKLKQLSKSDGVCVPLEAILLFAIENVLLHDATIHSIPQADIKIDNFKAIYIENRETEIGDQIEKQFYLIANELKLIGLDFIYIPNIVKDFMLMEYEYLKKVVKYMIPAISDERASVVCDNLRNLTTTKFCRDLLFKKLGLDIMDCSPSLLVKISDSDVVDKSDSETIERVRYSNFLQLNLRGLVLEDIHSITKAYHSMISCSITIENKPLIPKFIYSGFHRSLFDLIAFGRELKEYCLVFDFLDHKINVYLESIDKLKERIYLKLNPQETALYYMIVKTSLEADGLDWREHMPSKDKQNILAEYNQVYGRIGKAKAAVEYKDKTQVHHIKNKIRILRYVANINMFLPEHCKSGNKSYYKIRASSDFVIFR